MSLIKPRPDKKTLKKILDLASDPAKVRFSPQASEDLLNAGITDEEALEYICTHIRADRPVTMDWQRKSNKWGYVMHIQVSKWFYTKVLILPVRSESEELYVESFHEDRPKGR